MWILLLTGCGGRTAAPPAGSPAVGAPAVTFADITAKAGIQFQHVSGAAGKKWLPETMGSGCAFLDYDNDSFPDIYLTAYRGGVLLHNEGGYGFRVVPLALQPWSTSARS